MRFIKIVSLLLFVLIGPLGTSLGFAKTIFFDDFSDGDASDGMPVHWEDSRGFFPKGHFNVSGGDLILTPEDVNPVFNPLDSVVVVARDFPLEDFSIRTQVRYVGAEMGDLIGFQVRRNDDTNDAYSIGINTNNFLLIVREPGSVFLGSTPTNLNVTEEDVIMQLDAFGSTLSLWAWQLGEPMPAEPQITLEDPALSSGIVSLFNLPLTSLDATAVFRFVQVADEPIVQTIPEPSTFVLLAFGSIALLGVTLLRRRLSNEHNVGRNAC